MLGMIQILYNIKMNLKKISKMMNQMLGNSIFRKETFLVKANTTIIKWYVAKKNCQFPLLLGF